MSHSCRDRTRFFQARPVERGRVLSFIFYQEKNWWGRGAQRGHSSPRMWRRSGQRWILAFLPAVARSSYAAILAGDGFIRSIHFFPSYDFATVACRKVLYCGHIHMYSVLCTHVQNHIYECQFQSWKLTPSFSPPPITWGMLNTWEIQVQL